MTVITAESLAGGSEPDVISKQNRQQQEQESHSSHESTRVDKSPADLTTPCDEQFTFVQGSAISSSCDTSTTPSTTSQAAYEEEQQQQIHHQQQALTHQSGQPLLLQHYEQYAPRSNEDEGNETGDEEGSRNSTSLDADDVHLTSVNSCGGGGGSFVVSKGLSVDSPPPLTSGFASGHPGHTGYTGHSGHTGQGGGGNQQRRKQRKFKESHYTNSETSAPATVDAVGDLSEDQGQLNDQGYSHQVSSSISMEEASLSSTLTVHSTNSASVLSTSTTTSHREAAARKTGQITTACGSFSSINGNNNGKNNNGNNNCNSNSNNNGSSSNSSRSSSQVGGGGTNTRSSGSNSSQNKRHSNSSETSISGVSGKNGIHIASSNNNNNCSNNNGIICSSGDLLYESMVENGIPVRNSTPVASYSSSPAPPPLPPLLPSMTGTSKVLHSSTSSRVHHQQLQQQQQLLHQQQQQHLYPQQINESTNATFATSVQNSIANCATNDIHTDIGNIKNSNSNSVNGNDSTIKKGLLWQMKDGGFFSRWKERYFILTKDYLTCFKKSSSNLSFLGSEMGSFSYKLKLVDVDSINWKSPSDCTGRSKMIPKSIRNKNKKNQKARRVNSSFSSGGVSSDGDSGNECGNDHEHHNYLRYFSGDTTDGSSNVSRYNLDDHSSSCRSSNSSRKSSSKASNGREVISISIKNGSSHIDLWTWCDSSLDDWMNCLREASNHSKGRREALIRKSKTLCVPSPNHQPFALSSYWATASRNEHSTSSRHEESQLLSVLGSPAIPHRNQRDSGLASAQAASTGCVRSYSSLRMAPSSKVLDVTSSSCNPGPAALAFTPAILSESCQRRNRKSSDKNSQQKPPQSRSESMINFSKRVSITGQRYHGGETEVEEEDEEDDGVQSEMEAVVRIRRAVATSSVHGSPLIVHGHRLGNHSKGHLHGQQSRQQGSPSILSSLVSLDRRLMGSGAPGIPAHRSNVNSGSPAGGPVPNGNDSVRRSALLRSASGIAAAQAQAAAAAAASANFQPSYHPHGISTLGPNQQFNYPPLPPIPLATVESTAERPVPVARSLQVSPALTQRSLYAQHIFSQPESVVSNFCTTSKLASNRSSLNDHGMVTSGIRSSIGWMKDELLRSSTGSRMTGDERSSSVLKSATSEFSFVRPDSPLTLPYNKSRSFYGRPVSVSSGVMASNPTLNQNHSPATTSNNSGALAPPLPPPRPPLPKQLSLEESSTLFRCSAAATSAAARASDRALAKERIAAIRKAAAASAFEGPTSGSSTSSSGISSGTRSSLPEHHSQSLLMHLSSPSPRPVSFGYHQSHPHHGHLKGDPATLYDHGYDLDEYTEYEVHQQVPLRSNSSIGVISQASKSSNCTNSKTNDRRKNRMNRILEKTSSQYAQ